MATKNVNGTQQIYFKYVQWMVFVCVHNNEINLRGVKKHRENLVTTVKRQKGLD